MTVPSEAVGTDGNFFAFLPFVLAPDDSTLRYQQLYHSFISPGWWESSHTARLSLVAEEQLFGENSRLRV